MHKAFEIALSALAGAIVPAIGAIYLIGGQANRIEQLERRMASVEQRPDATSKTIDPLRMQCAKLAAQYATPKADRATLKEAMDALACFRTN